MTTYNLANSVDDTYSATGTANSNYVASTWVLFGKVAGEIYYSWYRYTLNIPVGSIINSSYLQFFATESTSGDMTNVYFTFLDMTGDPAWQNANGFGTANYADGTALMGIKVDSTGYATWAAVPAWAINNPYNSASLNTMIQAMINDVDYVAADPVGILVYPGTQAAFIGTYRRCSSKDAGGGTPTKLIIEYTPPAGGAQIIILTPS